MVNARVRLPQCASELLSVEVEDSTNLYSMPRIGYMIRGVLTAHLALAVSIEQVNRLLTCVMKID